MTPSLQPLFFHLELIPEKVDLVDLFVEKNCEEEILFEVESIIKLDVVRDDSVEVAMEEVNCLVLDPVIDVLLDGVIEVYLWEDGVENEDDEEIKGFLEVANCAVGLDDLDELNAGDMEEVNLEVSNTLIDLGVDDLTDGEVEVCLV